MPSVADQTPFNEYTANGATTVFPYTFQVLRAEDIAVEVDGVATTAYTLSGLGVQAGGNVTMTTAPANGVNVLIYRDIALTRAIEYITNGPFPAATINQDVNLLWQVLQAHKAQLAGVLRVPFPDTVEEMAEDAAARAGKYLAFDAGGQPVASAGTGNDSALRTDLAASSGSSLVSHVGAMSGEVSRTIQFDLLRQVDVLRFMTAAQRTSVLAKNYAEDVTTAVAAAFAAAGALGCTVRFPNGGYLMGSVSPGSNTTVWMDGGVTLRKKIDGTRLFRFTNVDNVHFFCNGATLDCQTSADAAPSQSIYFASSRKCSLRDANVLGAGTNKDCIYIGEDSGLTFCEDIWIIGGSCANGKRNGISVASGKRTIIDGVKIYGTTGSPGAGIDLEANFYDDVEQTLIRNCEIYSNQTYGIVHQFGAKTKILNNHIHDNTIDGIGSSNGGTQFNDGVYRSNVDLRGVSAFNAANGRVSVGGDLAKLPVGTIVSFSTRNGAAIPVTFQAQTNWVVTAHVAGSSTDILLAQNGVDNGTQNTLSDAGSGTMNADPALSDIRMKCMVSGQSSEIEIIGNNIHSNGGCDMRLANNVNVKVFDNILSYTGSTIAMQFAYMRDVDVVGNLIQRSSGTSTGFSAGVVTNLRTDRNRVSDFVTRGMTSSGCSYAIFGRDTVINCGGDSHRVTVSTGPRVSTICRNDENTPNTNGILFTTVTDGVVDRAVCKLAGTTNASSINVGTAKVFDSVVYDGSYYGTGSGTWDIASLADGAGETSSAVAVTGAQLGDQVQVSLSVNLQGITLTGWVSSAGNCMARAQNESGGVLDLASATVRFRVVR